MNIDLGQTNGTGTQYLEYNTIGGILDLYFLGGNSPTEVSQQYADVVGHSQMYPYWAFGFHQCKYGYWDVNMVAEVVGNYSTAGIPLEVSTILAILSGFTNIEQGHVDRHRLHELA
jgi:alpha-glucosidase